MVALVVVRKNQSKWQSLLSWVHQNPLKVITAALTIAGSPWLVACFYPSIDQTIDYSLNSYDPLTTRLKITNAARLAIRNVVPICQPNRMVFEDQFVLEAPGIKAPSCRTVSPLVNPTESFDVHPLDAIKLFVLEDGSKIMVFGDVTDRRSSFLKFIPIGGGGHGHTAIKGVDPTRLNLPVLFAAVKSIDMTFVIKFQTWIFIPETRRYRYFTERKSDGTIQWTRAPLDDPIMVDNPKHHYDYFRVTDSAEYTETAE